MAYVINKQNQTVTEYLLWKLLNNIITDFLQIITVKGGDNMSERKRNKKAGKLPRETVYSQVPQTFDESLDRIMQETLAAVVEKETYPRGRNEEEEEDDTQIYYTSMEKYKKDGRYEQDPYTVAQHMEDRTQFRH